MKTPESYIGRPILGNQILLSSAARTSTGTGSAVVLDGYEIYLFQLEVTATATDAIDTLDVFVQTTVDGSTWLDAVHFAQILGNGGAKRYAAKLSATAALTEYETGTVLGAAAQRSIFGSQWRVRWAITDADFNASFTFSVVASGT